jgi:hypothetical protein
MSQGFSPISSSVTQLASNIYSLVHQPHRERGHYQGPTCAIRIAYAIGTDVSFIACELIFGLTKCVERGRD